MSELHPQFVLTQVVERGLDLASARHKLIAVVEPADAPRPKGDSGSPGSGTA